MPLSPVIRTIIDLAFPSVCLGCGDDIRRPSGLGACRLCLAGFDRWQGPGPRGLDGAFSAAVWYDRTAAPFVRAFKYRGKDYLARVLGFHVHRSLPLDWRSQFDAVVPVPSNFRRKFQRFYSPSSLLADEVGRRLGVEVRNDLLRRRWSMGPQTGRARNARIENAAKGFTNGRFRKMPRCVLLVDDVCTTGATLTACRAILLDAGVSQVFSAVFAEDPLGESGGAG